MPVKIHQKNSTIIRRCAWVPENDPLYITYHDTEWGVPVHDDKKIFEFLVLESAQAGLSWKTVLHKRNNYKKAFARFNPTQVARFTEQNKKSLMENAGIIRNRQKIEAAIQNAKQFLEVQKEWGSFSTYMWSFVDNTPIQHNIQTLADYPKTIPQAVAWSGDLKKRGFSFLGPTVCYAHMQAVGMVQDHMTCCFKYNQ
jgi:DNA-3-methyladenine glycosylase I